MVDQQSGILLKFGSLEHMTTLLFEGIVYCNTLHEFAKMDENKVRGDIYENCTDIDNIETGHLIMRTLDGVEFFNGTVQNTQFRKFFNVETAVGNIFSTYFLNFEQIKDKKEGQPLLLTDDDIDDWCVVILNPLKFLSLLQEEVEKKGLTCKSGLVKYSDFKEKGSKIKRTPFMKDLSYKGQNEYRVYVTNHVNNVEKFTLGDISEFAYIVNTDSIKNAPVEISIEDGNEYTLVYVKTEMGMRMMKNLNKKAATN